MKTKKRILKAGLWAGLLLVMSCVIQWSLQSFQSLRDLLARLMLVTVQVYVFNDANQNGITRVN